MLELISGGLESFDQATASVPSPAPEHLRDFLAIVFLILEKKKNQKKSTHTHHCFENCIRRIDTHGFMTGIEPLLLFSPPPLTTSSPFPPTSAFLWEATTVHYQGPRRRTFFRIVLGKTRSVWFPFLELASRSSTPIAQFETIAFWMTL